MGQCETVARERGWAMSQGLPPSPRLHILAQYIKQSEHSKFEPGLSLLNLFIKGRKIEYILFSRFF